MASHWPQAESEAARLVLREFGAGEQGAFLRRVQVVDVEDVGGGGRL
ncbi:hypothetical protein [Actinomadura chokoriensis]